MLEALTVLLVSGCSLLVAGLAAWGGYRYGVRRTRAHYGFLQEMEELGRSRAVAARQARSVTLKTVQFNRGDNFRH